MEITEGIKVLKFDTFSEIENPFAHLRGYCDKFLGVRKNKDLLIRLFSQSLK